MVIAAGIMLFGPLLFAALQPSASIEQVAPDAPASADGNASDNRNLQIPPVSNAEAADAKSPEQAQLTAERSRKEVDQLGPRDRNTQSTRNLSDRSQGRDTRVVKLEGTDRCSAELLSSKDREYCQQVIENRSAEYTGPREIELSPEQELSARRNLKSIDGGTDNAIKRLANSRDSLDDEESQAIASTVLGSQADTVQPTNEQPAEQNLSAETQALIDAIVKNVTANPGS